MAETTQIPPASLLRRLNVIQMRKERSERTAKDYAIEFGYYLATAAEAFMSEQNRAAEADETPNTEYWSALQSAIHEFRKRADRTEVRLHAKVPNV